MRNMKKGHMAQTCNLQLSFTGKEQLARDNVNAGKNKLKIPRMNRTIQNYNYVIAERTLFDI